MYTGGIKNNTKGLSCEWHDLKLNDSNINYAITIKFQHVILIKTHALCLLPSLVNQDSLEFADHSCILWLPLVSSGGQRVQVAAIQVRPVTGGHLTGVAKATVVGTLWSETLDLLTGA